MPVTSASTRKRQEDLEFKASYKLALSQNNKINNDNKTTTHMHQQSLLLTFPHLIASTPPLIHIESSQNCLRQTLWGVLL